MEGGPHWRGVVSSAADPLISNNIILDIVRILRACGGSWDVVGPRVIGSSGSMTNKNIISLHVSSQRKLDAGSR
jgi:hypothetical protein